jgi:fatty acid desaturase
MDHRGFVAGLDADFRADLVQRSDRAGLRHLTLHLALIGTTGAWIGFALPLWPLVLPLHGVFLVFLFTLEHEATHKTPFANAALNEVVGRVCGFVLLLPFEWFRWFHMAHHRWTNIPGQDPELEGAPLVTRGQWLRHVSGLPYWVAEMRLLAGLVRGQMAEYVPQGARARVVGQARWMVVGYALVLASLWVTPVLFWLWLLPVVLGQPVLRLYLLAEHGDCPKVANMFENTRTTFTVWLVRVLAWNMSYHVEHHVMPGVPFHRLPQVHEVMKGELRVTAEGYGEFTKAYLARRR